MIDLKKMKRMRLALQLTMEEASERAGLTGGRQQWYLIESGRRDDVNLSTLDKVATALKCKSGDLLK